MPHTYHIERAQMVPRPRDEVFEFFSDAGNLERITPPWLQFHILTPRPIPMRPGTIIDYRLKLFGIPFYWKTLIESFEPPVRFTDSQAKGPYGLWHHTHEFFEVAEGTLCVDRVRYQVPLGPIGRVLNAVSIRRQLTTIFDYRAKIIGEVFAPVAVVS